MNEVNIIETNRNRRHQKKKHATRSCRHNKVILADRNIYHKPTLQIYIIIHNQFPIDPNQFTHQHFRSISSSTINLQILTKKKQIRGNKVPNDGDGERGTEWTTTGMRERGRDERERVSCDLGWAATTRRERGRDERVIELWESEEEIWTELR